MSLSLERPNVRKLLTGYDPSYFEARYNLGLAHFRSDNFEAAASVFERALEQRPNSYESAYNLGLTLLKLKRSTEAEAVLRKAISLEETPAAYYNLALSITQQGRHADANAHYEAVLRIDPKHARAIERLAEGKLELGDHDEALDALRNLVKLAPADPTAINAGIRLLGANEYALAQRYFEISADGDIRLRARSLDLIGRALTSIDPEAALAHMQKAAREFPDNAAIADGLRRLERRSARQKRGT